MAQKESLTAQRSECTTAFLTAKEALETLNSTIKDRLDSVQTMEIKVNGLRSSKKKKEKDTERLKKEMAAQEEHLSGIIFFFFSFFSFASKVKLVKPTDFVYVE